MTLNDARMSDRREKIILFYGIRFKLSKGF